MKRSEHLEPLSHDHYEGLLVAGRLQQGLSRQASPDEMTAYVTHFWLAHLARHFRQEEAFLLPLLETISRPDLAERMVSEHRLIRKLVVLVGDKAEGRAERLAELSQMMKDHIRFEERELFPALEEQASEEALREVGTRLHEAHEEVDWNEDSAFWE